MARLWALTLALAACLAAVTADQLPFLSPSSSSPHPRRVAIIGGGPSGTSAAYWLSKAQDKLESLGRSNEGVEIHLYEKDTQIGGRTRVVYPYDDPQRYPAAELGASIFADVNRNLVRAAKDFDLPTDAHLDEEGSITAVWDGQQFVVEDLSGGWWGSARLFWRYGYAPVTTRSLVADLKSRFMQLYDARWMHEPTSGGANETKSGFPWPSIASLSRSLKLDEAAAADAHSWFYGKGVSQLFVEEIIEAATRVNYGQNTDAIHALGGGVSLAASGARGIRGGNYRLFQEMLVRSNAKLHLGDHGEVTGIVRFADFAAAKAAGKTTAGEYVDEESQQDSSPKWWVGTAAGNGGLYDAVLVAAPWHNAGITLMNTEAVIPVDRYVRLHVTLVATNATHPKAKYFGRTEGSDVPTTILTTYEAVRRSEGKRRPHDGDGEDGDEDQSAGQSQRGWASLLRFPFGRKRNASAAKPPKLDFNSLNYLTKLPSSPGQDQEHLVKIFSSSRISDAQLDELFGLEKIGWVYRHEWDAYPELRPRDSFAAVEPDEGLFYLNALETLVSTMETSTVGSRNAVGLLLSRWYGKEFVVGSGCRWGEEEGSDVVDDDEGGKQGWDGWGCQAA